MKALTGEPEPGSGADLVAHLVARAQSGDAAAFSELYAEYADRVFRFCLARVGQISDAEDLTQLTFLRVIEALPRYESRGIPFGAWLFRLARNAVIDFVRARREHRNLDDLVQRDDPTTASARIGAVEPNGAPPDELSLVLPFLTDDQRDVLAYRFLAGLSARETGRLMGKREAAVRALQYRALATLRRHLAVAPQRPLALQGRTTQP
jgi:RNA polymerase sigma-70 factor (ECF subfamily)